jgi:hypothetical protein
VSPTSPKQLLLLCRIELIDVYHFVSRECGSNSFQLVDRLY